MLGLIITTNEIVHNIRVTNAFCDLFFVANIPFLPTKTRCKRMQLLFRFTNIIINKRTENTPLKRSDRGHR